MATNRKRVRPGTGPFVLVPFWNEQFPKGTVLEVTSDSRQDSTYAANGRFPKEAERVDVRVVSVPEPPPEPVVARTVEVMTRGTEKVKIRVSKDACVELERF